MENVACPVTLRDSQSKLKLLVYLVSRIFPVILGKIVYQLESRKNELTVHAPTWIISSHKTL